MSELDWKKYWNHTAAKRDYTCDFDDTNAMDWYYTQYIHIYIHISSSKQNSIEVFFKLRIPFPIFIKALAAYEAYIEELLAVQ